MLTKARSITQSVAKRVCAKALGDVLHGRGISRDDAGDVLGCSGRTIANRLDADSSDCQMTVYELARGIREFGPAFGNAILIELTGHKLVPVEASDACHDRTLTKIINAGYRISRAREDGVYEPIEDKDIAEALEDALPDIMASILKGKGRVA